MRPIIISHYATWCSTSEQSLLGCSRINAFSIGGSGHDSHCLKLCLLSRNQEKCPSAQISSTHACCVCMVVMVRCHTSPYPFNTSCPGEQLVSVWSAAGIYYQWVPYKVKSCWKPDFSAVMDVANVKGEKRRTSRCSSRGWKELVLMQNCSALIWEENAEGCKGWEGPGSTGDKYLPVVRTSAGLHRHRCCHRLFLHCSWCPPSGCPAGILQAPAGQTLCCFTLIAGSVAD